MPLMGFLCRTWVLREELEGLERRIGEVKARSAAMTADYSGLPRGQGEGKEALWALLGDLEAEKAALLGRLRGAEEDLDAFLARLRAQYGLRSYAILRWYYRLRKPWKEIQRGLEEIYGRNISMRAVMYWHKEARRQAEELYRKTGSL